MDRFKFRHWNPKSKTMHKTEMFHIKKEKNYGEPIDVAKELVKI